MPTMNEGFKNETKYFKIHALVKLIFHCQRNNIKKNKKLKILCVIWQYIHVGLFATPWTVAYQSPRSVDFSRQEYWSGVPFPSPGDLPDPGIEPGSPALRS